MNLNDTAQHEGPTSWQRSTPWRQCSVICSADAQRLGLEIPVEALAVVISHDCDLVTKAESEPNIEVVVATRLEKADPMWTYAQNPRFLHMDMLVDGVNVPYQFDNRTKFFISKSKLIESKVLPDKSKMISSGAKHIFQRWLAARYRRASIPDSLNELLSRLRETFEKSGGANPKAIYGIWIDFDPEEDILTDDELYELWLIVVYSVEIEDAKSIADRAAERIRARIEKLYKKDDKWLGLQLRECVTRSETEFTLHELSRMRQYRLEYVSLKHDNLDGTVDIAD